MGVCVGLSCTTDSDNTQYRDTTSVPSVGLGGTLEDLDLGEDAFQYATPAHLTHDEIGWILDSVIECIQHSS